MFPDPTSCLLWTGYQPLLMTTLRKDHSGKDESMNIYVEICHLTQETPNSEPLFERFGQVDEARVVEDKYTQRSRGFGFVEMGNESDARKAIADLNGTDLQGRNITVNEARPRESRGPRRDY